jgi:hypothetical protein
MSWEDVENVMQAAIVTASRLSADRVTWSYQNVNEPEQSHVVITFGGSVNASQDWIRNTQDLSRPKGQEMRQQIRGVRDVPFDIDVFTDATSGSGAARHLADLIRTRLRLDSIRLELRRYGISPFDTFGAVNWIPDIPTVNFRGRATLTIRCYVPVDDCDEYVGYIARVQGLIAPSGLGGTGLIPSGQTGIPFDWSGASGYS